MEGKPRWSNQPTKLSGVLPEQLAGSVTAVIDSELRWPAGRTSPLAIGALAAPPFERDLFNFLCEGGSFFRTCSTVGSDTNRSNVVRGWIIQCSEALRAAESCTPSASPFHETQKERGATAVYMPFQRRKCGSELNTERWETGVRVEEFRAFYQTDQPKSAMQESGPPAGQSTRGPALQWGAPQLTVQAQERPDRDRVSHPRRSSGTRGRQDCEPPPAHLPPRTAPGAQTPLVKSTYQVIRYACGELGRECDGRHRR